LAALTVAGVALWGAYVGWQVASLAAGALALVVTSLLLCIALVDFQVRRIPNLLVGALLVCAVLQALLLSAPTVPSMVLGLLVGGGTFLLLAIIGRGAMGMGDVKLAAAIGALLGLPAALQGLFVGILCGGLAAAILLLTKRVGRKDPMAYGPWLALGAWVVLVHAWGLWPGQ
jgi:leader peptidase (prepilin peptidase)/N-methyltransferase